MLYRGKCLSGSIVVGALLFTALFLAACGDEAPLPAAQWKDLGALPADFECHGMTIGPDGYPYIAGNQLVPGEERMASERATVYRWNGSRFVEAFKSPTAGTNFVGIGCMGGAIWASGSTFHGFHDPQTPYIVRYSGGEWEEIVVPSSVDVTSAGACRPLGRDFCWIALWSAKRGFVLHSYNHGVWIEHLPENHTGDGPLLATTASGKTFVYYPRDNSAPSMPVWVTDDRGVTWYRETCALPGSPCANGFESALASDGDTLYVATSVRRSFEKGAPAYASPILRRDNSPAGSGVFEMVYDGDCGEGLGEFWYGMAFKSPAEGYAGGPMMGCRYRDGNWVEEDLTKCISGLRFHHLGASGNCFWAIGHYPTGSPSGMHLLQSP